MAVEAAKNRARKRDVGLMERAFRQVAARQRVSRLVKARYAARGSPTPTYGGTECRVDVAIDT